MRTERKQRLAATLLGAGGAFPLAFALSMLWGGCPAAGPHPGPGPKPPTPGVKGDYVVVMVDHTAPSIPNGLIIDGPQMRALKKAGICTICGIAEQWTKDRGYDQLLTEAGGAPALVVLTKDGSKVYAGRCPTDAKALEALLAKYLTTVPPPLPEPTKYAVISRGGDTKVQLDNGVPYIDDGGHKRFLTARSDGPKFAALPRYGDHLPVFPQAEWHDVNRSNIFGDVDIIFDQNGHGSCVGNGWVGALERCRALAGMQFVKLSPAFLYAHINGGRDQGAVISDGIEALKTYGTCKFETMGQNPIYLSQIKMAATQEALNYKLLDAYRCDTWEETCSAILTGLYLPVYGYMVGNNFGRFDQYGVAGHDRGPGNHCNFGEGLKKLPDGRWVIDDVNSWRSDWGPFKNGHVYLDKNHLFGNGDQADVCVIRIPSRLANEPNNPPIYKPKAADVADVEFPIAP